MTIATRHLKPLLGTAIMLAHVALAGSARAQDKPKTAPPPAAAAPAQPATPTPAPPPTQSEPPSPGWAVQCANPGKGLECKATQTVVLAKTRQLLISIAVNKPSDGSSPAMMLHLPHGIFNPAGVTMAIDEEKAETLEIQTCDAKGCYAGVPITPEKLAAMTKGSKLNVVFQDLKKQQIKVPVPLKGFEDAYKKL